MFDKNKLYSYKELLDNYSMLNIEFKFYGQNDKGNLLLYLMTKDNKIFIFTSNNNGKSKEEYLQYELKDIETLKFKYESEVEMQDYNINVIVNTTIDKLTKDNDDFVNKELNEDQINGIAYIVVEKNSNTTLFSGIYEFGKGGFLNDLESTLLPQYKEAKNKIAVANIKEILNLYKEKDLELDSL